MLQNKFQYLFVLITAAVLAFPGSLARGEGSLPVLVGIYPSGELYQKVNDVGTLDAYFGAPAISIAGTFLDLESPSWLINAELDAAWNSGYVPFVNLGAGSAGVTRTAEQIANGVIDGAIRNWGREYADWSQNGARRAFIAPLQEVNGDWVSYHGDPQNYIRAFLRIRQIFLEEGVSPSSISWVFAPNGWHHPARPQDAFENYFPGHSVVDAVGFSSFNFGNCWTYTQSESYEQIYKPYLDRMSAMAPGKPIFIAEIGSVSNGLDRAAWFTDTLSKIGAYPGVRAIIYFNRSEPPVNDPNRLCETVDYSLDSSPDGQGGPAAEGKDAFKAQVTQYPYGYWAPDGVEMNDIAFGHPTATFEDVWPASAFAGKNTTPYYQPWVERLVSAGITGGCGSSTIDFDGVTDFTYRYYCPDSSVTRAQMAVFLLRGMHGSSFVPPAAGASTGFGDVPVTHWAAAWIKQLAAEGITGGCGEGNYCPENPVTRAQMAVFLLKAKYGASYAPPAVGAGTGFNDVPTSHWAAAWIKQLAAESITGGCGSGLYCPEDVVTRAQMAVFLVRTFGLP